MAHARRIDYAGHKIGFAQFMGLVAETTQTDCSTTYVLDTDEDEIVIYQEATDVTTAGVYDLQYQLPYDFYGLIGASDDVSLRAIQSSGGTDMTITVEVYDNAGSNISDASIATTSLTASWATYDCALTNPDSDASLRGGDHIILRITTAGVHNDDDCKITIPKIKVYLYYN